MSHYQECIDAQPGLIKRSGRTDICICRRLAAMKARQEGVCRECGK